MHYKKVLISYLFGVGTALCTLLSCQKSYRQTVSVVPLSGAHSDTLFISNISGSIPNERARIYLADTLYTAKFKSGAKQVAIPSPLVAFYTADQKIINIKIVLPPLGTTAPQNADQSITKLTIRLGAPPQGGNIHLVIYDSLPGKAAFKAIYATTDDATPSFGKFKLRIANFNSFNGLTTLIPFTVSLRFGDSSAVAGFQNIPYGALTDYQELEYDSFQFQLVVDQTKSVSDNGYWRQSYFFKPGGLYTLFAYRLNGNDFLELIKDSEPAIPFSGATGKAQVINADPTYDQVTAVVKSGAQVISSDLLFGTTDGPFVLHEGNFSYQFLSPSGAVIAEGEDRVNQLSNVSIYLLAPVGGKPRVLVIPQRIVNADYSYVTCGGAPYFKEWEQAHVNFLNLSPDKRTVKFIPVDVNGFELSARATDTVGYATNGPLQAPLLTFGTGGTRGFDPAECNFAFNDYPLAISCRTAPGDGEVGNGQQINFIYTRRSGAPINSHPGDYTVALIGTEGATELGRKPSLIVIKNNHTHNEQ